MTQKLFKDGVYVDAPVMVDSFMWSLHYGSSVWEGVRYYAFPEKPGGAMFMGEAHARRLLASARLMKMQHRYTAEDIMRACLEVATLNGPGVDQYIRPILYYSTPPENHHSVELDTTLEVRSFPLASRRRRTPATAVTLPLTRGYPDRWMQAKTGDNYGFMAAQARWLSEVGADVGLLRSPLGHYTEAFTANLFIVKDGVLTTPPSDGNILPGITRSVVMHLAGVRVEERVVTAPDLYTADEVFVCGTHAEILPIKMVDGYLVGDGKAGPVTELVETHFFQLVESYADDV